MIAVLAPHVIDQIAAGEVIERPASVVKELVDNAIDAGAGAVAIEVAAGGRAIVRVTDDGCGMSAKDAVLALERHATSKLRQVDDLWGLSTMGFRGEALPSIASVSRMTLITRRAGDDAATRIVLEGGRLVSVAETGAAVGTTVEVADLLYNVPARLKFLKGEATEASHITELVGKLAMAYPRLHVRLRHNGRTALDAPPDRDGFARAQALLGGRIAARMVPVHGEESGVRVTAYLGAPELAQATSRGVQLFVGRRPVRDRSLLHALAMGYGELVPRGRYPLAIVMLDMPAGAVDVNVHPQKLEVRFSDPAVVAAAVRHIVQAGITAARWRDDAGAAPVQLMGIVGGIGGIGGLSGIGGSGGGSGGAGMPGGVAAPALPFDGQGATRLAERHAAQAQSRQVSLGFTTAPEVAAATRRPGPFPGAFSGSSSPSGASSHMWSAASSPGGSSAGASLPGGGSPSGALSSGALSSGDSSPDESSSGGSSPGASASGARPGSSAAAFSAYNPREWARSLREDSRAFRAEEPRAEYRPGGPPSFDPGEYPDLPSLAGRPGASAAHGADHDAEAVLAARDGAPYAVDGGEALRTASDAGDLAIGTGPVAPQVAGFFSQLRYLGQLDLTYLACEGDGELVLIDQHAAHERVELARLRERHARGGGEARVAVQSMLFPVTLEATPAQLALVGQVGALLAQVGFEVEPFGKTTLAVKAVPAGIRHGEPTQLLRRMLEDWASAGVPGEAEFATRLDALLGAIACHSVVRAGDRLSPSEAETLLRSLDGVDLSLPAPHGRAVLLRLPLAEIGRRFGR
jgi:DNA mismatch repair protein MutL